MIIFIKYELISLFRSPTKLLEPLLFFLLIAFIIPFGFAPEPTLLQSLAPAIIWSMALLACILASTSLFQASFHQGIIEQLVLTQNDLLTWIICKCITFWIAFLLPLIIASGLIGLMWQLPAKAIFVLILGLLIGTPSLVMLIVLVSALTLSLESATMLLALIVLPLVAPLLILGTGAVNLALSDLPVSANLLLLTAIFLISIIGFPFLTNVAIKLHFE